MGFQPDGFKFPSLTATLHQDFQRGEGFPQNLAQPKQSGLIRFHVRGNQKKRIGGNVGGQYFTVPVRDDSPGRLLGNQAEAVGVGHGPVFGIIEDLKVKKFEKYHQKRKRNDAEQKTHLFFGSTPKFTAREP